MRSSLAFLLFVLFAGLCPAPALAQYQSALPGYRFEFPRDHFSHPSFQTEWWYYTGNLTSSDGHAFGFELTFFRQGVSREPTGSAWDIRDLFLAHLALSDLDSGKFYHWERVNRAGPGLAGADGASQRIWNGNWQIVWRDNTLELRAITGELSLTLALVPQKPPVIHGENGASQKAPGPGRASHYISLSRLAASGSLTLASRSFRVSGLAWMDHEFFTHQLDASQSGWDWFSLQLDDNTELMLYRLRRRDGSPDPFSAGTYIDAHGVSTHLRASDFSLTPSGATWTSPTTSATYPVQWHISVPRLGVELDAVTPLASQELSSLGRALLPNYWEGAIRLSGHRGAAPLSGVGYLEMTGYDRPVDLSR